jgi:hypothetical protein
LERDARARGGRRAGVQRRPHGHQHRTDRLHPERRDVHRRLSTGP